MTTYGIFDKNKNYKLLRYSDTEQTNYTYQSFDYATKTYHEVKEICLPDIEYSEEYIGKDYDPNIQQFMN